MPDRLGPQLTLDEVADELVAPADRALPATTPTAGARSFGDLRALPAATRPGATCSSFHEYFHGDTGAGLGASHQTGWTGLVADLIIRRNRKA